MIIQTFYAGLNFSSRNLLDSATGGTFMSLTLGAASKLLDNMMVNYSEWHTERAPQGKKVNSVEETSSLNDKIDTTLLQKRLLVTGCFCSSVTGKPPVTSMLSLVDDY
jgi:hypothetical protein